MSFLFLLAVLLATQLKLCVSVGTGVQTVFVEKVSNSGAGVDDPLSFSLFWDRTRYDCVAVSTFLQSQLIFVLSGSHASCQSSNITSTRNLENPYYAQIHWDAESEIVLTKITITDSDDAEYTVNDFCLPPMMECSLDKVLNSPLNPSSCSQWPSKTNYSAIALGGSSGINLLYVDFEIFGDRFANTVIEGGIRPPKLVSAGIINNNLVKETAVLSVQWDTELYRCDITDGMESNADSSCNVAASTASMASKICPGIKSRFYLSIFSPHGQTGSLHKIHGFFVEDEIGNVYRFDGPICRPKDIVFDLGKDDDSTSLCSSYPDTELYPAITLSEFFPQTPEFIPFFMPTCFFDYANTDNSNLAIQAAAGYKNAAEDSTIKECWDPAEPDCYGGDIPPQCPATPQPTNDPTTDPTLSPTTNPTVEPTDHPTLSPSLSPSDSPTLSPSQSPSVSPSFAPSRSPTLSPTDPTNAPTLYPTLEPTKPTTSPTSNPSPSPSANPTSSPTVVPTQTPTSNPSVSPSAGPSMAPSMEPTLEPTNKPTTNPTKKPTSRPTFICTDDDDEVSYFTSETFNVDKDREECKLCVCVDNEYDCFRVSDDSDILIAEYKDDFLDHCQGQFDCEFDKIIPATEGSFGCECSDYVCDEAGIGNIPLPLSPVISILLTLWMVATHLFA